jgi:tetratricopeptide (TPR) repeat protein
MSIAGPGRGLLAGFLLLASGGWCAARIGAYEMFEAGRHSYWNGRFREAFERYRWGERLAPLDLRILDGEREVLLGAMESSSVRESHFGMKWEQVADRCAALLTREIDLAPLRADTWSGVADFYGVLKPLNQQRRVYSLATLSPRPEENLEVEDLLQIRALEVAARLDPNSYYLRDSLGDLAWGLGLRALAVANYREAVTLLPDHTKHLFVGALDLAPELVDAVAQGLERSVRPPRSAEAEPVYRNLGIFLMERGRFREARAAFDQAERHSRSPSYAFWQAYVESRQGNLDEAIRLYRKALSTGDPSADDRLRIYLDLGELLDRRGRYAEAALELNRALTLSPRDSRALLLQGKVYESLGRAEDAEEMYVKATETGSDHIAPLANLVDFYRRIGKPGEALVPARKLVELVPDEPVYRQQVKDLEDQLRGSLQ